MLFKRSIKTGCDSLIFLLFIILILQHSYHFLSLWNLHTWCCVLAAVDLGRKHAPENPQRTLTSLDRTPSTHFLCNEAVWWTVSVSQKPKKSSLPGNNNKIYMLGYFIDYKWYDYYTRPGKDIGSVNYRVTIKPVTYLTQVVFSCPKMEIAI